MDCFVFVLIGQSSTTQTRAASSRGTREVIQGGEAAPAERNQLRARSGHLKIVDTPRVP